MILAVTIVMLDTASLAFYIAVYISSNFFYETTSFFIFL